MGSRLKKKEKRNFKTTTTLFCVLQDHAKVLQQSMGHDMGEVPTLVRWWMQVQMHVLMHTSNLWQKILLELPWRPYEFQDASKYKHEKNLNKTNASAEMY